MKKFIIEDKFWELFPDCKIGTILCSGIDNTSKDVTKYEKLLYDSQKEIFKYLTDADFPNNDVIKVWREAFTKFRTKKGARSSIEALLKRVNNGGEIENINPLVDIYNSISLKYAMPCGGEDIDKFQGNMRLTKALGNEEFIPIGGIDNISPYEGEIVYKDDLGAICRCWLWREAQRTMLTENTKNAILCIELVDTNRNEEFQKALTELSKLITDNLGGTCKINILDINNKEIVIA